MAKTSLYFKSIYSIYPAISGRYGYYAKCNSVNFSEKNLAEMGYELVALTKEEATAIRQAQEALLREGEKNRRKMEMDFRKEQVSLCLNSEPIKLGEGNNLWESVTKLTGGHLEAYVGCSIATAYIKDDMLVAWHRGNSRPDNAPVDCDVISCEVSCTELLF